MHIKLKIIKPPIHTGNTKQLMGKIGFFFFESAELHGEFKRVAPKFLTNEWKWTAQSLYKSIIHNPMKLI